MKRFVCDLTGLFVMYNLRGSYTGEFYHCNIWTAHNPVELEAVKYLIESINNVEIYTWNQ